jgi:hypothetical protein
MILKKSNTIPCFWTVWAAGRAHVKSNLRSGQPGCNNHAIIMQYNGRNADISWYFMIFHISSRNSSRSWYVFWLRSTQRADVRKAGTLAQRSVPKGSVLHSMAQLGQRSRISDQLGHQGTRHSQQRKGRWQVISGSPPAKCNRVQCSRGLHCDSAFLVETSTIDRRPLRKETFAGP